MEAKRFNQTDATPSRLRLLVWLLVPGAVFFDRARDGFGAICGTLLFLFWLTAMTVFWIAFGLPVTWLLVCAMTAAQSLSAVAALQQAGYPRKVAALGAFTAVLACAFIFQSQIASRVALSLTVRGERLIVNPWRARSALDRGEWIAYRAYGTMTVGQIFARAGDTVTFQPHVFMINGEAYRRPIYWMPVQGELIVPDDSYFVWPEELLLNHGRTSRAEDIETFTIIPKNSVAGVAYHRWLWRKQSLSAMLTLKQPAATPHP
jgi:type IV secretory pathway protease TraF